MSISFGSAPYLKVDTEALVFPVFEDQLLEWDELKKLDQATGGVIKELVEAGEIKGKVAESCFLHRPSGIAASRLLLMGCGKRADWEYALLRKVAGAAWRFLNKHRVSRAAFYLVPAASGGLSCQLATEGFVGGAFESDSYKTEDRSSSRLEHMEVLIPPELPLSEAEEMSARGRLIGESLNFARFLVNEPGNRMPPSELAAQAEQMARQCGLQCTVVEKEEMIRRNMGGILGVSQGSEQEPKLILLEYVPETTANDGDLVALVGKGVTFDSGGISIKPPEGMEEMKADMAGGAAVIAAMRAIAGLRPRVRVLGVVPAVENMPSGRSFRPGDVITLMNGRTVEVANTDAEGRLILADALSYAVERGAKVIIDVATLTGACKVALGTVYAGLFSSDEGLAQKLLQLRPITGEKLWRLPLDSEYKKPIQSDIADIKNIGNRWGGASYAAMFLQYMVGGVSWAHLDIAGVDWLTDAPAHLAKGPTGFGFRTLLEFVLQRS
jgi:leucyl aminopeptidase